MLPQAVRPGAVEELDALDKAKAPLLEKKKQKRFKSGGQESAYALRDDDYEKARIGNRRKQTRGERRKAFDARGKAMLRAMRVHVESYRERLKSLGQADADPVGVHPRVHRIGQLLAADPSGRSHLVALCMMPRALAQRILSSCTRIDPVGESAELPTGAPSAKRYWRRPGRRSLRHPASLRSVGIGVLLWAQSASTKRRGFSRVVRGLSRPLICKLLAEPEHGFGPSVGAVYGTAGSGMPGAVPLLKARGVLSVDQPPGDKVSACDRGPSGHAFNVYWFYAAKSWPEPEPGLEQDLLALHIAQARAAVPAVQSTA
jgi:hypothetical protein